MACEVKTAQLSQAARSEWQITLFIQNASELPVEVHVAQLAVDPVGRKHLRQERIGFVKCVRFIREQSRLGANGRASRSTPRTSGLPRTSTPAPSGLGSSSNGWR